MENNKQTAVEWLVEELADLTFNYIAGFSTKEEYDAQSNQVIEQAKEMEKQQIKQSWNHGFDWGMMEQSLAEQGNESTLIDSEHYYNEEYGSKKSDKCCTPPGQIKRYIDCIGCDKNPKNNIKDYGKQ